MCQKSNHKNKKETVCTENSKSWSRGPTTKLNSPFWTADKLRGGVKGGSSATHRKREEKLLELSTQAINSFSTEDSDHEPKGQQKGSGHKPKSTTGGKGKGKNCTDQENSPPRGKKKERKKKTLVQALGQLVDRYSNNDYMELQRQLRIGIKDLTQQEQLLRKTQHRHAISRWTENMTTNPSARAKWINKSNTCTWPMVEQHNNQPLLTNKATVKAITEHWQQVWHEASQISDLNIH